MVNMHSLNILSILLLALHCNTARIVLTNDDGWAEGNIRALFDTLTASGHNVLVSAPARDKSGTNSAEEPPKEVVEGCVHNSCPPKSPPIGNNSSEPRLNWVNSFPVTAMKVGVEELAPRILGGPPDIVVSGTNVGSNTGLVNLISGTVGAAAEAAKQLDIPAIAFSGDSGYKIAWNIRPAPGWLTIYADLATNLTNAVIAAGKPYLPPQTYLNVNFPQAGANTKCTNTNQFKFILTRINRPLFSEADTENCNEGKYLPREGDVSDRGECLVSVSVGNALDKTTASAENQAIVVSKIGSILSCLKS